MKKQYAESSVTSVRCEHSLIRLADLMDITLSEALKRGILFTAEFKLEEMTDKFPAETHDLFLALKHKDLEEFSEWLQQQKFKEKKIAEMIDQKRKSEQVKLVREWDPDEERYVMKKVTV
jgi:predicted Holliday junction resolvase-like endonuclease